MQITIVLTEQGLRIAGVALGALFMLFGILTGHFISKRGALPPKDRPQPHSLDPR